MAVINQEAWDTHDREVGRILDLPPNTIMGSIHISPTTGACHYQEYVDGQRVDRSVSIHDMTARQQEALRLRP